MKMQYQSVILGSFLLISAPRVCADEASLPNKADQGAGAAVSESSDASVGALDARLQDSIEYFSLPLPGGKETIDLALIRVSDESNYFSTYRFSMGNVTGIELPQQMLSYCSAYSTKSWPVEVAGTLCIDGAWYLLMGKTEVTRGQYRAVMGQPAEPESDAERERLLPMTNVTVSEVELFMQKLNYHLQTDPAAKAALDKLLARVSRDHQAVNTTEVFVRLPTEIEWEFCARGARCVEESLFNAPSPYRRNIADYENVEGNSAEAGSDNKLSTVGYKELSPCGLADMLGNASEFVAGPFAAGYTDGRLGGIVIRGSNASLSESTAVAFFRREVLPVVHRVVETEDGGLSRKQEAFSEPYVGFRVCLGTLVRSKSTMPSVLDEMYGSYCQTRIERITGLAADDSVAARYAKGNMDIGLHLKHLDQYLGNVRKALDKTPNSAEGDDLVLALQGISAATSSIKSEAEQMSAVQLSTDLDIASTGIYLIYVATSYCARDLALIENVRLSIELSEAQGRDSSRAKKALRSAEQNIDGHWRIFCEGCKLLAKSNSPYKETTTVEFQYQRRLKEVGSVGDIHEARMEAAYETYKIYKQKNNIISDDLRSEWLMKISAILD